MFALLAVISFFCSLSLSPVAANAQELAIVELAPDVFAAMTPAGHPGEANAGFIVLDDSVLVIDTHLVPAAARQLIQQISSITALPIRYVVNTHWHPDHTHGNESYRDAFGVDTTFISHLTTREDIATLGKEMLERKRPNEVALSEVDLVLPNLTFTQQLTLHNGGRKIQLLFFGRGHTRGDIVVYLADEKVAFVGDLITGGPPFARDGYPFSWVQTLESLQQLDIETIVSGHGKFWHSKRVIIDRVQFLKHAVEVINKGAASSWNANRIAETIDLDAYRDTFEPEPALAPWRSWMQMLATRGLLELQMMNSEQKGD